MIIVVQAARLHGFVTRKLCRRAACALRLFVSHTMDWERNGAARFLSRFTMLEIELKFPVESFDAILLQLKNWNIPQQPTIDEADHYFNAPDRDFARTDEAFRLRCIGDTNRITYKGPRQRGAVKTRTEIEIAIEKGRDAAEQFRRLVQHLGYRPTAVVKKRRICFDFERDDFALQACLDEVETLGRFVEIEIVTDAVQRDRAEQVLLQVTRELGLQQSEPRSYLEMVLAKQAS
jgi:adenylate cyclase class 2